MGHHELAVFGPPDIELDLLGSQSHSRSETGHGALRGNCRETAVGAGTRVRHMVVVKNNRASALAVFPGPSALLHILPVGAVGVAESAGLVELLLSIDLHAGDFHALFEIQKNPSVGSNDHASACKGGSVVERDSRAQHVCVAVVGQERGKCLRHIKAVALLLGAAYDDVHVLLGYVRILLVEVEIVAGQKRKAHSVQFKDHGAVVLVGVRGIQAENLLLAPGKMLLVVPSDDLSAAVEGQRSVAEAAVDPSIAVCKHYGIAASCRRSGLFDEPCGIALHIVQYHLRRAELAQDIGALGKHDNIYTAVQAVKLGKFPLEVFFASGTVNRITRLENTDVLLHFHPLTSACVSDRACRAASRRKAMRLRRTGRSPWWESTTATTV